MINMSWSFNLALLVDGKTAIQRHIDDQYGPWKEIDLVKGERIRMITTPSGIQVPDSLAVMTQSGRILVSHDSVVPKLEDITSIVRGLFGLDTENIKSMRIWGYNLIILSDFSMASISLEMNEGARYTHIYRSPSEIDSVCHNFTSCSIITTSDNRLFGTVYRKRDPLFGLAYTEPFRTVENIRLNFLVQHISEVRSVASHIVLLTGDGLLYGRRYNIGRHNETPFVPILSDEGVIVTKIIPLCFDIIFITAAGRLYKQRTYPEYDLAIEPLIIRELSNRMAVNVVKASGISVVVQCAAGSSYVTYVVRMPLRANENQPDINVIVPLYAFNNIHIVSISYWAKRIYFFTDDDAVFWSDNIETDAPTITRDTFFDKRQLPCSKNANSIRSALSAL